MKSFFVLLLLMSVFTFTKTNGEKLTTEVLGKHYYSGDHTQFKELKKRANVGDINAQFFVARMLYLGDGVTADKSMAEKYYRKAVKGGHKKAMGNLALLLYKNDPDSKEIEDLFKGGIKGKGKYVPANYASFICQKGDKSRLKEAEKYVAISVERGNEEAGLLYAQCLHRNHKSEIGRYIKWLMIGAIVEGKEKGKSLQQIFKLQREGSFFYELYDAYLSKKMRQGHAPQNTSKEEYTNAIKDAFLWLKHHKVISEKERSSLGAIGQF